MANVDQIKKFQNNSIYFVSCLILSTVIVSYFNAGSVAYRKEHVVIKYCFMKLCILRSRRLCKRSAAVETTSFQYESPSLTIHSPSIFQNHYIQLEPVIWIEDNFIRCWNQRIQGYDFNPHTVASTNLVLRLKFFHSIRCRCENRTDQQVRQSSWTT